MAGFRLERAGLNMNRRINENKVQNPHWFSGSTHYPENLRAEGSISVDVIA